ncbi:uncharacterized protein CIMG_12662 [Coccidioides immitis RS]|uniref:Uncharacterized protein n=1 Tax=Coccidioides immitis (strain RS) TaxID=246410 RepID=A0A0D8JSN2_COCIM|nr:uncharacterized protein CIMG_12662 [Coccidioides immitis RS]KJF59991.1 hypothetical protein CIMG_12662 [Coccidioides immitis RS]
MTATYVNAQKKEAEDGIGSDGTPRQASLLGEAFAPELWAQPHRDPPASPLTRRAALGPKLPETQFSSLPNRPPRRRRPPAHPQHSNLFFRRQLILGGRLPSPCHSIAALARLTNTPNSYGRAYASWPRFRRSWAQTQPANEIPWFSSLSGTRTFGCWTGRLAAVTSRLAATSGNEKLLLEETACGTLPGSAFTRPVIESQQHPHFVLACSAGPTEQLAELHESHLS